MKRHARNRHSFASRFVRPLNSGRPLALTRRRVLAGALGTAGAATLGAGLLRPGGGGADLISLVAAQVEPELCEPKVWPRQNGLLSVELIAGHDSVRGGGAVAYVGGGLVCEDGDDGFGGLVPGPTLYLLPGDRLKIKLVNMLDAPTNLHVHGLHVSPIDRGDNVFVSVKEHGGEFNFEYQIPEKHPSGLFWYHPHFHGEARAQVNMGLAGAIIIGEDPGEAETLTSDLLATGARYPGPPGVRERLLVLQELVPRPDGATHGLTVNGLSVPRIGIRRGEEQRWRIVNASATRFFNLRVVGHRLQRIAIDGNYIPNYGDLPEVDVLPLGPAERAEVLITGTTADEEPFYEIRALLKKPDTTLPAVSPFRLNPVLTPFFPEDFAGLSDAAMTSPADYLLFAKLVIEEDPDAEAPGMAAGTPPTVIPVPRGPLKASADRTIAFTPRASFDINGQAFNHGRVDETVELGVTETWRLVNEHDPIHGWHPFHLHVNDFDVLRASPSGGELELPFYQDTVPLPPVKLIDAAGSETDPANREAGWVEISSNFFDFTGRFVYHCHFLNHEDDGMMGVVEVVRLIKVNDDGFPEMVTVHAGPSVAGEVNSGTTVVWANLDSAVHTITADESDSPDGRPLFDSGELEQGRSFAHTFDAPGLVAYHCAKHPEEKGTILVTATQTVEIDATAAGLGFAPAEVTVAPWTTVSWTNRDDSPHTVEIVDPDAAGGEPLAVSTALEWRHEFRHTLCDEGDFTYQLTDLPGVVGKITVAPVRRRSVSIAIRDDGYEPPAITVPHGSTVTWTNRSSTTQTITQEGWSEGAEAFFDSGRLSAEELYVEGQRLQPGQRFSHHFKFAMADQSYAYFSRLAVAGTVELSADAPAGNAEVVLLNGAFQPQWVTVRPGASVTWRNDDLEAHTITFEKGDFERDLPPDGTESRTFEITDRGVRPYYSKAVTKGTIIVGPPTM